MRKKILAVAVIVAVTVIVVAAVAMWILPGEAEAARQQRGQHSEWTQPAGSGQAAQVQTATESVSADLTEDEVEALLIALDDEYRAWAVYEQVISDLGAARPFPNIQRAEENHIAALTSLLERYGVSVPENEWIGNVPSYDTLGDACATGLQAETDNAALYDQLFSMVDNVEILRVFTALQQASETKHLPAFERCAN
jgi:hypothetical protein